MNTLTATVHCPGCHEYSHYKYSHYTQCGLTELECLDDIHQDHSGAWLITLTEITGDALYNRLRLNQADTENRTYLLGEVTECT